MAQDIWLEEFLYRGRPPGSTEPPAYHVILARKAPDGFGGEVISTSKALTPEAAAAAGFPLPAIMSAIDQATMAENASLKARVAELEAQLAERTAPPAE